jgi:NAD(P)-dependent dehydrogenase (short-subunit alcohol dehydrogenase family)
MQRDQKARWLVVTGATGGIGKVLVARLVARGQHVIAAARDPGRLCTPPGSGRVVGVRLDMEQPSMISAAAREITQIVGSDGVSGLVNMAGVIVEGPIETIPPAQFRRQLEINLIGPIALTQALLPVLKRARGKVVNIGAISAHLTVPFYGPIAASKSALASLSDAMRMEFAQFGIDVVLIEPGAMKTGIFATSRAARDANLSTLPEMERHYRPALIEMDRAFEKAGADDPEVVAKAAMEALFRRRAKPRIVVGKGTRALLILSRLPIPLRDRLVKSALGLTAALKPTA